MAIVPANAASYLVICTPNTCLAEDGSTQIVGTAIGRFNTDGTIPLTLPASYGLIPDDGQTTVYSPAMVFPFWLSYSNFIARFTVAEQVALFTLGITNYHIPQAMAIFAASGINLNDPTVTNAMAFLVSQGVLTAQRSVQILNFGISSP